MGDIEIELEPGRNERMKILMPTLLTLWTTVRLTLLGGELVADFDKDIQRSQRLDQNLR
jgi:hypothetical protein